MEPYRNNNPGVRPDGDSGAGRFGEALPSPNCKYSGQKGERVASLHEPGFAERLGEWDSEKRRSFPTHRTGEQSLGMEVGMERNKEMMYPETVENKMEQKPAHDSGAIHSATSLMKHLKNKILHPGGGGGDAVGGDGHVGGANVGGVGVGGRGDVRGNVEGDLREEELSPSNAPTYPANAAPTSPPNTLPTSPTNAAPTSPPNAPPTYPLNAAPTYPANTPPTYPPNAPPTYPPNAPPTAPPNAALTSSSNVTGPPKMKFLDKILHKVENLVQGAEQCDDEEQRMPVQDDMMNMVTSEPYCLNCRQIYDDPRLLNCLHTFCRKCLHEIAVADNTGKVICCPVCKDPTPIPPDGIDAIQVNLYLEHESIIASIEARMKTSRSAGRPDCEECSRQPPHKTVSFCCTCISFLCDPCHAQHIVSRKSHLHHKVLSMDDTTDLRLKLRQFMTFLPTTCPIHMRQEIAFFCKECKILVCVQCALSKHPGHRVEELADFVKRQKGVFCDDVHDMPEVVAKLEELMAGGRAVSEGIKAREEAIEENIIRVFAELHQSLNARKEALLQECVSIATAKMERLTGQLEDLALLRNAILTCTNFVDTSKNSFDPSEFISVLTTIHRRIEAIKKKARATSLVLAEDDTIHFNSDATTALNCMSHLGSISSSKGRNPSRHSYATPTNNLTNPPRKHTSYTPPTKHASSSLYQPPTSNNSASSSVHNTPSPAPAPTPAPTSSSLYNNPTPSPAHNPAPSPAPKPASLQHLPATINPASLHDPIHTIKTTNAYHVAVHRSGDYVVANHVGDCVEVYEGSSGRKRLVIGRSGTRPGQFKRPLGVSIVGDIIYVVEYTGARCQKLTINGEFLCEIGTCHMTGGWGCAVSKNGVLYVAEETNNRVQAFTQDGKSLKILCSSPAVYAPRDVAIDQQGRIHVAACGSKCIKVFDSNGSFVREYGGNGTVLEPSGVAIDQLNFCFVADWAGKSLHVFDPYGKRVNKMEFDGCISGVTIDHNNHVHVVNHSTQTISMF